MLWVGRRHCNGGALEFGAPAAPCGGAWAGEEAQTPGIGYVLQCIPRQILPGRRFSAPRSLGVYVICVLVGRAVRLAVHVGRRLDSGGGTGAGRGRGGRKFGG